MSGNPKRQNEGTDRVRFKLGVSLDNGFARINTFSWDAYHEGGDLISQVESYKELHGHYPELVQVDKIYATRENRTWLAARGIRITAVPLGRRKGKEQETYYQKRKRRKEAAERNHIEGKFGQGKNGYNLNEIRARLRSTSESWVACIFFIMNLILYEKETFFGSILARVNRLQASIQEYVNEIMTTISLGEGNLAIEQESGYSKIYFNSKPYLFFSSKYSFFNRSALSIFFVCVFYVFFETHLVISPNYPHQNNKIP